MTAKEAHQAQWQKLKDEPLQAKLKYIFTYYWAPILGAAFVVVFAVSWIVFALTQKEVVLSGCLLNSTTISTYQSAIAEDFMADQQIDSQNYTFDLASDIYFLDGETYVLENIVTRIGAKDLDFVVTDLYTYSLFSAHFAELETIFTEEQLAKYSQYFVYVERSAMEKLNEGDIGEGYTLPEYHTSSEGLKEPVALGLRIPESSRLLAAYSFVGDDVILGIAHNTQRLSITLAFLDYILQEP